MHDPSTTISLVFLTAVAFTGSAVTIASLRHRPASQQPQRVLVLLLTAGCAALFFYRTMFVHKGWMPLTAHVDGLVMITTLAGAAMIFLQSPARMPGISAFGMPLLTVLLLWAICASRWTLDLFHIDTVLKSVHLLAVYLGALFIVMAAIAGGMFLYGQGRLRRKKAPTAGVPFANLESIERAIVRTSILGFTVLTVGLVTGLVIVSSRPGADPAWWVSGKLVLTFVVWSIYAMVMNLRFAVAFRGARAAWMSIVGIVLLMITFGLASALSRDASVPPPADAPARKSIDISEAVAGPCIPPEVR